MLAPPPTWCSTGQRMHACTNGGACWQVVGPHLGPEQDEEGGHLRLLSPLYEALDGVLRLLLCQVCAR